MSEYAHQLRAVCGWNRRLARDNSLLRIKLRNAEKRLRELELENANLAIERDAINTAFGAAMNEALKAKEVVTKFVTTIAIVILGLIIAIGAVGPRIAAVLHALVPVILVTGVVAIGWRFASWYTRH